MKPRAMYELTIKSPGDCSSVEIDAFFALIREGGEVSIQGLRKRIRDAAALVFARVEGLLVGVAALKNPKSSHRQDISEKSGAKIPADEYPYELGWVYVSPEHRRKGLSLRLSEAALSASNGAGVFATSRTDNVAMHRSLAKCGFAATGDPYPSERPQHSLQVFVRPNKPLNPTPESDVALL